MANRKKISIEDEILKQREVVQKCKEKFDKESKKLNELLKKQEEEKKKELLDAIAASGKSIDEVISSLTGE